MNEPDSTVSHAKNKVESRAQTTGTDVESIKKIARATTESVKGTNQSAKREREVTAKAVDDIKSPVQ